MTRGGLTPDASQWLSALNHPLRRGILRHFDETEIASATDLARTMDVRLGNVAYHVKVLAELNVLKLVRQRQVRGAREKLYRAVAEGRSDWVGVALERTRRSDGQR